MKHWAIPLLTAIALGVAAYLNRPGPQALAFESSRGPNASAMLALTETRGQASERLRKILRTDTTGAIAFYLKQVDGPVLAALNEEQVFEPASTIKVLFLLYALREVQAGRATLDESLPVYSHVPENSCPGDVTPAQESLRVALELMMRQSDNARTKAIGTTFDVANVNALARDLGLINTQINHTLGCGEAALLQHNSMTLLDAARLYEGVANGAFLDIPDRATFFELMAGKARSAEISGDAADIWQPILKVVQSEAPLTLSRGQLEEFRARMDLAYKDGRYTLCQGGGFCVEYRSVAGWLELPFCDGAQRSSRQYVFGLDINDATGSVPADTAFDDAKAELVRGPIRAAVATWAACTG